MRTEMAMTGCSEGQPPANCDLTCCGSARCLRAMRRHGVVNSWLLTSR